MGWNQKRYNMSHRGYCYVVYLYLRNKGGDSEKGSDFPLSPGLSLPRWS